MTPRYYHNPPPPVSTRARCPVCHEAIYGRAEIHPQCAVHQSERPEPKVKAKAAPVTPEPGTKAVGRVVGGLPTAQGTSAPDRIPSPALTRRMG